VVLTPDQHNSNEAKVQNIKRNLAPSFGKPVSEILLGVPEQNEQDALKFGIDAFAVDKAQPTCLYNIDLKLSDLVGMFGA
jgi:hypothetical protein